MYSNKKVLETFEQMIGMGGYYSTGRPVYTDPEIILEDTFSKVSLEKDDVVLDVGCGTGLLTIPFSKKCKQVYAVDAARKVLDELKENCKNLDINNINFQQAWVTDLPFNNNFFDKVIMYAVIHYLENEQQVEKCLKELVRVCKDGGRILIAEIPTKQAREEFQNRVKTAEELEILQQFEKNRKEYDNLFRENVSVQTEGNTFVIDEDFLMNIVQQEGCKARLFHQDIRQPFSLTRRDFVIYLNN